MNNVFFHHFSKRVVVLATTWHGSGKLTLFRRLRAFAAAHGVRCCGVWGGTSLPNEPNLISVRDNIKGPSSIAA